MLNPRQFELDLAAAITHGAPRAQDGGEALEMFTRLNADPGTRLRLEGPFLERVEATAALISERVDGVGLLVERAMHAGHVGPRQRQSPPHSVGGSAVLLDALDGRFVLNLARPVDRQSLPALVGRPIDPWDESALVDAVAELRVVDLDQQAMLLGLAAAAVPNRPLGCDDAPVDPQLVAREQAPVRGPVKVGEVVESDFNKPQLKIVDFTSLWAGPLCSTLIADVVGGASMVTTLKVEGTGRPDGARRGPAAFFERLNGHKTMVEVDFASATGRSQIAELVASADVVLEGSRPRVFERLGIDPAETVRQRGGVWLSFTAYGRTGPWSNRIGFGDDVAAGAGIVASGDQPRFVGDALADPVGALVGAAAALHALRIGAGCVIDVALREALGFLWGDTTAHQI